MAAILNGIAYHDSGLIPYGGTFLVFAGYMVGAMRLSALSELGVIYVLTHDSIGLGEDGPTHQPVETLASLRSIPNLLVIRPGDGNETSGAYKVAVTNRKRPTVLALSRQAMVNQANSGAEKVAKGGYILEDSDGTPRSDPDRHRHRTRPLRQGRRRAARRGQARACGVDALRGAVRGAGRRLPRVGAAGRRAQAPGGGSLQLLRLAQVHRLRRRHRLDRPLRRLRPRRRLPGEVRLHRRQRGGEGEGARSNSPSTSQDSGPKGTPERLSIVLPTYNERQNIAPNPGGTAATEATLRPRSARRGRRLGRRHGGSGQAAGPWPGGCAPDPPGGARRPGQRHQGRHSRCNRRCDRGHGLRRPARTGCGGSSC